MLKFHVSYLKIVVSYLTRPFAVLTTSRSKFNGKCDDLKE